MKDLVNAKINSGSRFGRSRRPCRWGATRSTSICRTRLVTIRLGSCSTSWTSGGQTRRIPASPTWMVPEVPDRSRGDGAAVLSTHRTFRRIDRRAGGPQHVLQSQAANRSSTRRPRPWPPSRGVAWTSSCSATASSRSVRNGRPRRVRLIKSLTNRAGIAGELCAVLLGAEVVVAHPHDLPVAAPGRAHHLRPELLHRAVHLHAVLGRALSAAELPFARRQGSLLARPHAPVEPEHDRHPDSGPDVVTAAQRVVLDDPIGEGAM